MARHRRQLIRGERQVVDRLVRDYRVVESAISLRLAEVAREIEAARSAGVPVGAKWLARRERYRQLLSDVETQVGRYARSSGRLVLARRRETSALGIEHGRELVKALGIRRSLAGVPSRAFEAMVSQFEDGSPVLGLFDGMASDAIAAARRAFLDGIALGKNPRDVARSLAPLPGLVSSAVRRSARDRAVLIARDGAMRAYTSAQSALYAENADVVLRSVVVSALDGRTCYLCVGQHGRVVEHGESIHRHPGCRCALRPIVAGMPETVSSGEEWLRSQAEAVQLAKLGRSRFALFRAGLPLRAMYEEVDHPKWGPGLRALPLSRLPSRVSPSG
ncbi:MAG: hypothetical protein KF884_10715 [Fimbriimonadaceae bacterium]|nr:hypothetical protein [Fimbriimonadaceae bacterium]QYK58018.1 MAG: hypothetical protein KF884_10715 [Fimbriimonadaceae bacterium]